MPKYRVVGKPCHRVISKFSNIQAYVEFEIETHNFMQCLSISIAQMVRLYHEEIVYKLTSGVRPRDLYTINIFEVFSDKPEKFIGTFTIDSKYEIETRKISIRAYNTHGYVNGVGFSKRYNRHNIR